MSCAPPGCWTDLLHCLPESLSCRAASAPMTQGSSPATQGGQNNKQQWNMASLHWQHEAVSEDEGVHRPTSSSFRMLHGRGVIDAGLEGGIFCLISWAAASNLSTFLLEITTLQPEHKIVRHDMTASTRQVAVEPSLFSHLMWLLGMGYHSVFGLVWYSNRWLRSLSAFRNTGSF